MGKCNQCFIRQFNNLNAMSPEELKEVSDHKDEITFKKGEIIFDEGSHVNGVYCLKGGVCKISQTNPNGKEQIIKFSKTGDLLGYHSVMMNSTSGTTVTALNEVTACFIPKKQVTKPLHDNPNFNNVMMHTICKDLEDATQHITNMSTNTVHQRMADLILFLKDTYGVDDHNTIQIQLSRKEIASSVGTAVESAIRILSSMNKDKLIELNGKSITLTNERELKKIALGL